MARGTTNEVLWRPSDQEPVELEFKLSVGVVGHTLRKPEGNIAAKRKERP